ncbi:MAG: bifunctional oligoribonuclease/PAP phosphatase NrnA [Clostridiales bacterium]|nr:bifunctional oligoribonuclease/PAP phosphatase NrnA [Clostridiales bacterium]
MFEQVFTLIKQYDTIVIHRHSSPDGDALGSQIGLKYILQDNFPDKKVYVVGDEAKRYAFMDGSVMDEIPDETYQGALAIVLDCGASHLISDERYKTAAATARLDHHIYAEKIADVEVVDTSYESCCGLVTELALESGLRLSPASAKALYTGMVTDSGRFRYDSTTSNTFRLASALMEQKFDTNDIYAQLYADDFTAVKLRAQFVLKIQFTDYRVAYIYTTKEELPTYGVDTFTISRGMVNTMGDIRGVDIWVNFTETEDKILVEIRSNKYNINPIAVKYGGGGHAKASGASVPDKATAMALLDDLNAYNKGV